MKTLLRSVLVGVLLTMAVACGPLKYQVQSAGLAAGADATIVADVKRDQGMTLLQINAANLAPAGRIKDGATNFVAWTRKASGSQWARLGALQYDEGSRKAKLENVNVAELSFDLQISVENDVAPATPSSEIVFKQHIN